MKVGDLAFLTQAAAHRTVDAALFLASTVVLALVKGVHRHGKVSLRRTRESWTHHSSITQG